MGVWFKRSFAWVLALVVAIAVFALDRPVLRQVDYTLLATFVCFFVFVASVKAYAPISAWLEGATLYSLRAG